MPTPQIQNIAQAFMGDVSSGLVLGQDRPSLAQTFRAAVTTQAVGDLIALSSSAGYCIRCLTNTGQQLLVGVALEAPTTVGNPIDVIVYGPSFSTNKDNTVAVTAADLVTRSAAVTATVLSLAGSTAITQLKDTGLTIGVVWANQTAGDTTANIFVVKV